MQSGLQMYSNCWQRFSSSPQLIFEDSVLARLHGLSELLLWLVLCDKISLSEDLQRHF